MILFYLAGASFESNCIFEMGGLQSEGPKYRRECREKKNSACLLPACDKTFNSIGNHSAALETLIQFYFYFWKTKWHCLESCTHWRLLANNDNTIQGHCKTRVVLNYHPKFNITWNLVPNQLAKVAKRFKNSRKADKGNKFKERAEKTLIFMNCTQTALVLGKMANS